jgi:hypothetical protein
MQERQKMLMVTVFYNPAEGNPPILTDGPGPMTEETLFTGIEECLEQGSLVRVSHMEANLLRLDCDHQDQPPAHEWVGLTFVPVQPAVLEPVGMEEEAYAY